MVQMSWCCHTSQFFGTILKKENVCHWKLCESLIKNLKFNDSEIFASDSYEF